MFEWLDNVVNDVWDFFGGGDAFGGQHVIVGDDIINLGSSATDNILFGDTGAFDPGVTIDSTGVPGFDPFVSFGPALNESIIFSPEVFGNGIDIGLAGAAGAAAGKGAAGAAAGEGGSNNLLRSLGNSALKATTRALSGQSGGGGGGGAGGVSYTSLNAPPPPNPTPPSRPRQASNPAAVVLARNPLYPYTEAFLGPR